MFETKGKRLIWLRNFSAVSREEFAEICGIKFDTYKSWELDRASGLSKKGAINICQKVKDHFNIQCSIEWLLLNEGIHPVFMVSDSSSADNELEFFRKNNSNILTLKLASKFDQFGKTDILGAKIISSKNNPLTRNEYILFSPNKSISDVNIGKIICNSDDNSLELYTPEKNITINTKDYNVAIIIWHRKLI